MQTFEKIIHPGTHADGEMFIKIRYEDRNGGMELAISGVIGPKRNGDATGSCGQIRGYEIHEAFSEGWDAESYAKLMEVWERWHLNRTNAGTPAQSEWIRDHKPEFKESGYTDWFVWACEGLAEAGLNPDGDYRYGSAWLAEEVPEEVLIWLKNLPDTNRQPAWV
jgi:hypothetical protein